MASFDPLGDRDGLTGTWEGYYAHDVAVWKGKTSPITARIVQAGRRIEGTMTDGVTDWSQPLRRAGEPEESLQYHRPLAAVQSGTRLPPRTVAASRLPAESDLRGRVRGARVAFTKTYRGVTQVRYLADGEVLGARTKPAHVVHYRGVVDWTGETIEGSWAIRFPGPFGRFVAPMGTGTFLLRRRGNR